MDSPPNAGNGIHVRCKTCGFVGPINDFDVIGADDDKLFCNQCGKETRVERIGDVDTLTAPKGPPQCYLIVVRVHQCMFHGNLGSVL